MPHGKSTGSGEGRRRENWLDSDPVVRSRPWALSEELFGPRVRQQMLARLESELREDRSELARLEEELRELARIVARDAEQLATLRGLASAHPPEAARRPRGATASGLSSFQDRALALRRCEGFRVDSPNGRIGLVESLRYSRSIDEPDEIEVRGGWLGRRLVMVPADEVDQIFVEEGRLVVRETPAHRRGPWPALLSRLRERLPVRQASSDPLP